ncbi:MAG: AraC family transcriptional regulator, partial [Rectinemataceae bacterium]|nr:AraC family transcriptional regulator [Rectinemataceae bacterium]
HKPQIVITDIRMPKMDGLEFVRRLKVILPRTKVLILSCHDEFNFAREALKLGVEDYLLKMDVSPATLVRSLAVVKAKCLAEKGDDDDAYASGAGNLAAIESLLCGEGSGTATSDLTGLAASLDPVFSGGKLVVLSVAADRSSGDREMPAGRNSLLVDSILGLFKDCLKRHVPNLSLILPEESIASVLAFDGICSDLKVRDETENAIRKVKESLGRSLGVSVSVGVSRARQGLGNLAISWEEARQACGMKFFHGPDKVFFFGRPEASAAVAEEESATMYTLKSGSIAEAVLDCDKTKLLDMIRNARQHFIDRGAKDRDVKLFFYRLTFDYIDQIESMGGNYRTVLADEVAWIERIMRAENIDEIVRHAEILTGRLLDFVREHRSEHRQKMINKAHAYIDANFASDISLDSLSEHLAINSSYFCKIYRQSTGGTFIEKLTKVRLGKARTLLQSTDCMVYDIAEKVGYRNPEYFCRLFKKITGLTPMQYRSTAQRKV